MGLSLSAETQQLIDKITFLIKNNSVDVIVFEDYDKGVITPELIQKIVVEAVKKAVPKNDFLVVTPGIRADFATGDDQKRVTTFRGALARGSDYVVIGRPILRASDRSEAVKRIIEEVSTADQ